MYKNQGYICDVERWYVLRLPRTSLRRSMELEQEMSFRKDKGLPVFEYFAPLFMEACDVEGVKTVRNKPFCLNYVFMRATVRQLLAFRRKFPDYNLVKDTADAGSYLYVPDKDMRMFMFVAKAYKDAVPCYAPDSLRLSRGDRVRIIGGQFSGVEGILLTQQGKGGGRVVVNVCNRIAVPTLSVSPEYIEIISFSDANKHVYKKLDRYYPVIRQALHGYSSGKPGAVSHSAVVPFVSGMRNVRIDSGKVRCRYLAFMMVSHKILGNEMETEYYVHECASAVSHVTNQCTRAFIFVCLYACTDDAGYLNAARDIAGKWDSGKVSGKQRDVMDILGFYDNDINR